MVQQAGFADVRVLSEHQFPMDHMSCDSTANAIMGNIRDRQNGVQPITDTISSIKLSATKHADHR
jgi:hypothetical protein